MKRARRADANLVLTGFMGTGKTSVGQEVARRMGREFVDMDEVIARRAGKSIPAIFAEDGEAAFRQIEAELCRELAQRSGLVIATGGGALVPQENRHRMEESGLVICLRCSPEEILRRLERADDRPLLNVADRREEVERLLEQRREAYAAIRVQLDTTGLAVDQAVERILALWEQWLSEADAVVLPVRVPGGEYEIHLGRGALHDLGEHIRSAGTEGVVAVVSNPTVWGLYGEVVEGALREAGLEFFTALMPDGEAYKTLETVSDLYGQFLKGGLDRSGAVVALGGGVVGDVAGFAAATYMRGMRLVQVPTTLLSMVDSSVGGKTGVDLPQGKNLVGAFYQPARVVIDPDVLETLPMEELRCGLAETVKAAVIGDPALLEYLEALTEVSLPGPLAGGRPAPTPEEEASTEVDARREVLTEADFQSALTEVSLPGPLAGGRSSLMRCSPQRTQRAQRFVPIRKECRRRPTPGAEAPQKADFQSARTEVRLPGPPAEERPAPRWEAWDWPRIIRRALAVKIAVVEEDPLEQGRRAVLNLGHTVGHALERLSGYTLRHGEAVSIGLVAEAWLAAFLGHCDPALPNRLAALLDRLGLPTRPADFKPEAIWEAMQTDKKRRARRLRFALPRRPGDIFVTDEVRREDVLRAIEF